MEDERIDISETDIPEEENQQPVYHPRPKWQIACAWIGVAIMVISVILYYWQIASGGF